MSRIANKPDPENPMPKKAFPPMRIVNLQAENIKRLIAVDITPDSSLVQITGKNGAGKTSILDAIWWAFTGVRSIQSQPIRAGAVRARIRLDMGELVITRKFSRKKADVSKYTTEITVENADGAQFRSPQTILDTLIGELSFDPLEFARMKPREQFDALRVFVPEFDFSQWTQDWEHQYEERRNLNRSAKERRSAAESIALPDIPIEPVDEERLVAEMAAAAEHNSSIAKRKYSRENVRSAISVHEEDAHHCLNRIEQLKKRIEHEKDKHQHSAAEASKLQDKLDAAEELPAPVDTDELAAQLNAARETNAQYAEIEQRERYLAEADSYQQQADEAQIKMETMDGEKRAKIAAAKLPVAALSFGDGEIFLDGLPFEQASDAQQLRASVGIAMAANPTLRVLRIRDGSLLDDDGIQTLSEMAEAEDYQVWIERVDNSGKIGFVIEEGELK